MHRSDQNLEPLSLEGTPFTGSCIAPFTHRCNITNCTLPCVIYQNSENLNSCPESCAHTGLKLLRQVSVCGACTIVENASPKEVSDHIEAICTVAQLREELVLHSTCISFRQQPCMNIDIPTGP